MNGRAALDCGARQSPAFSFTLVNLLSNQTQSGTRWAPHSRAPALRASEAHCGESFVHRHVTPSVSDEGHPAIRHLRTVCRCNNIKHGTIEKAIRGGATNVAEVGRITTATTGQCGGSCTPTVVEMIDEIHGTSEPAKPQAPNDEDAWWVR